MGRKKGKLARTDIQSRIVTIRGRRVILDADLARLYGVETKRLNEQVRRNEDRFPDDFAFQLTAEEVRTNWSQIATSSGKHRGKTYRPFAFTEHGAIMAANILRSPKAIQMSVFVVRAFVRMREELLSRHELEKRLDQIEKVLLVHNRDLEDIYTKIRPLLLPPETPEQKDIGFHVREKRARYGTRRKS
jgi:hypothetical protein